MVSPIPVGEEIEVAKPELGTKRHCAGCGAKFYDLNRDPIVCPKCGTVFELQIPKTQPEPATAPAKKAVEETEEMADVKTVPLEEAEEKLAEPKGRAAVPDVDEDGDDDIALDDDTETDGTFLADDDDEDVTVLIGDVESDEEA